MVLGAFKKISNDDQKIYSRKLIFETQRRKDAENFLNTENTKQTKKNNALGGLKGQKHIAQGNALWFYARWDSCALKGRVFKTDNLSATKN